MDNTEQRLKEWLGEDNQLGIDIWHKKYQYEDESFDEWLDRVSAGDEKLRQLIEDGKFLFGGRVLANRGVEGTGNYFNCFSAGYVQDDYIDIMDKLKEVGLTFKVQGGQGISLSKLRPKGTPIGNEYESDGIMPFIEMFNCVTQGTSQGGARKGALMISLDARHKEALEFITLKTDLNAVTKANLSLEIDDEFMEAVQQYYENGDVVTIHEKREYSGHVIEYDIVPITIYKKMMEIVWDYGEPGCIFTNRFRNFNFLENNNKYNVETSNPCGEQPLKAQACCNLGSLNLYKFVHNKFSPTAYFDFEDFIQAIYIASQALDDIIDENVKRLPDEMSAYKNNALDWRNIGLGVFGYADMLMALRMTYGSEDALVFTESLFRTMMQEAIKANHKRASARGSYPMYNNATDFTSSTIYRNHMQEYYHGFRNCSLLSIAPTGSIGTMMGLSGGIEPEFSLSYTRRTDNLNNEYKIEAKVVKDYRKITGEHGELPKYFITSGELNWANRIKTQSIIQNHIDTAISSTVNLPYETTKGEIEKLYLRAWQAGLKGVTIFRDGCKRLGILTNAPTKNEDGQLDDENIKTELTDLNNQLRRGDILDVSDDLLSAKRTLVNGCGKMYLHLDFDEMTGEPLETWIECGSGGGCERNLAFISRLMSLALRGGIPIEAIIDQAMSIKPCKAYCDRTKLKHDTSRGTSCPQSIGYAMEELYHKIQDRCFADDDGYEYDGLTVGVPHVPSNLTPEEIRAKIEDGDDYIIYNDNAFCPECGAKLQYQGGCVICAGDATHEGCGWSRCG